MGIVISACMTWVSGAETGLGKVGGRVENVRRRGGSNLQRFIHQFKMVSSAVDTPIKFGTPKIP